MNRAYNTNVLDRLRYAFFRRKHGPEAADHIQAAERELAAIQHLVSKAWCEWFWKLPPEAWPEALNLQRRQRNTEADHEAGIRLKTQGNRLSALDPDSPEAIDARRLAEEHRLREEDFKARQRDFVARYGRPPG